MSVLGLIAIVVAALSLSGCSPSQPAAGTATPAPTAGPTATPTPLPAWYFTPQSAGWPFNVTNNASFTYTFTNYLVKPDPYVRFDSYNYTTVELTGIALLHLVYRTKEDKPTKEWTQYDVSFLKYTGEVVNAKRGTGPEGGVTGISELSKDQVTGSVDVRGKMSDWTSIREKAGSETVTVPAGTFNCTKYNVRFNETFVSSSIWMADFVPAPVKREMYGEAGLLAVYNLTSYSIS